MPHTKCVNGKRVPLTAEEEAARDAEELAWAARPPSPREPNPIDLLKEALMANGAIAQADLDAARIKLTK